MIDYKYRVRYSNSFKRSYKKIKKQGKDVDKLKIVVDKLANKQSLEPKYQDHNLYNDKYYRNVRECHIEPDWLLVYQYIEDELVLLLVNTGSHSNLF